MTPDDTLTLALPSKGALEQAALNFLKDAGLKVYKPNARQYTAIVSSDPRIQIIFQRATDIYHKVEEGTVDLGITGYDIVREHGQDSDSIVVINHLGFGACELVLAVPDSWLDITTLTDLADLAVTHKQRGEPLRIATKYQNVTRDWLYGKGVTHFTLVNADGALEAAPRMGYADLIADLTETGTTLKENRLKIVEGGTVLESDAVLIGNRRNLSDHPGKLALTRKILEMTEAHLRARRYVTIQANIKGPSAEAVSALLNEDPNLAGLIGPSVATIYPNQADSADATWFEINILLEKNKLMEAVDHLRAIGGTDIAVSHPAYLFDAQAQTYQQLLGLLNLPQPI